MGQYYRVRPDNRDLNYDLYFKDGETAVSTAEDFNSHNTEQLDVSGMVAILRDLPYVKAALAQQSGRS
jgi:UDP-N-acetylglucosamine 4,6-dehydratase/5-epimerase